MDLSNIIQTSLGGNLESNSIVTIPPPRSNSETIVIRSGGDQITLPNTTTNISGSASIQLPSNATFKDQSLVISSDINTNDGPLLCQLDDNSYILIDGLDSLTTATTTVTSTSPTKTMKTSTVKSPLAGVKQFSTSPLSSISKLPGTIKLTSTVAPSVTKGWSPPKAAPVASSVTFNSTSQSFSRPFIILPSPPNTSKANSMSTKDSNSNAPKAFPINFQAIATSTTSSKPFNNIITSTSSAHNSNAPLKYILIPQSKVNTKIPTPVHSSTTTSANSGMKTITLTSVGGKNPQTVTLPFGTSLVSTSTKPMVIKPNTTTIPPSKINLQVKPIPPVKKVQSSHVESTNSSESSLTEDATNSSDMDKNSIVQSKSPTLFEETVSDIHETCPAPPKSVITYSRVHPKITVGSVLSKDAAINSTASTNSAPVVSTINTNKNVSSQPAKPSLPLQFIVPSNNILSKSNPTAIQNRKRKVEPRSMLNNKRMKSEQPPSPTLQSVGEAGIDGKMIREVISSRLIAGQDKAIISTASSELKKLVARRELLLKQLNTSCKAFGKVDYKLTISGSPINVTEIYQRITLFQQQFESDLMNLDWAVSAMHKLYSELTPKDETRSTEDILRDLLGSDGTPEDPKAKYDKLKTPSPKRSRVRTPKKSPKTVFYKGEKDCPPLTLEERKVPDKPDPSDGKFHCELCTKIFLKQISLAKHLEFDHPPSLELEKKMTSPRSPKLPHACRDCDKSFHSSVMLAIHRSKEHDAFDNRELSRVSKAISKRSVGNIDDILYDDLKSPSEDESKTRNSFNKANTVTTRSSRSTRKTKKPKRPSRAAANKDKAIPLDNLDFLCDSDETLLSSPQNNWRETDLFDPDVPIECTDENPIIPLRALSEEVIDAYTYSSRNH